MTFSFTLDDKAIRFCEHIVAAMWAIYDIAPPDGIILLNSMWQGQVFEPRDLRYHFGVKDWADNFANPRPYQPPELDELWQLRNYEASQRYERLRQAGKADWSGW